MIKGIAVACALVAPAAFASLARADVISEIEPNDTQGTAQNLDGFFSVVFDPNVEGSATDPHVTVQLDGSFGNDDWFVFTTLAAGTIVVDVDDTGPIPVGTDYFFELFDGSLLSLGGSDDAGGDPGDNTENFIGGGGNPRITTGVLPAGTYYIQLQNFGDAGGGGGEGQGEPGSGQSGGTINVTAQGNLSVVTPEPGSIALFGLGLAGLAGVAVRRRRRAATATAK